MHADDLQILNDLCGEFELELQHKRRPQIANYLQRCPAATRVRLFRELLALHAAARRNVGESPVVDDYLREFPEYGQAIQEALERHFAETVRAQQSPGGLCTTEGHQVDASPAEPPAGPQTAAHGSRFRTLHPHAQGGLGEVFVAEDLELHRKVALKQIRSQYASDPDSRSRFIQEAEITGSLEHPGIVPVYGFSVDSHGRPYYAMRFIHGQSFRQAIEEFHARNQQASERWLEFRQLLRRFVDVCNALEYAHSRGVLHRDIKPSNVMLGRFGETLVVDWGLAKTLGTEDHPSVDSVMRPVKTAHTHDTTPTVMGTVVGTPAYMSPEQAAGNIEQLSAASDVYSLGATLFHLLTGKPPLVDSEISVLLDRAQRADVPRVRQLNPQAPKALDAVCAKAMHVDPAQRYPAAAALARDIEKWLGDEPVSAYAEPRIARAGRWARRHASFVSAIVVAAVLLTGAAAIALVANERAEQRTLNNIAADRRLVRNELLANRFRTAESILDQLIQQLRTEGRYPQLLREVQHQRTQVHRLIEFERIADRAWYLAGEVRDQETMQHCTTAIQVLGIRDEPAWWKRLDRDYDLSQSQKDRLARDVHRLLLLQASILTKAAIMDLTSDATARCNKVLRLLDWAERFEPSAYTRLVENFCHFRLGQADKIKPVSTLEPTSAADYFYFGFIYLFMANFPNDASSQFVKQMVHQISGMEFKDELAKSQAYFRRAAELEPDRYWHHFMVALAQYSGQDYSGAELALNACIALDPDSIWAYVVRGDIMMRHALTTNDEGLRQRGEALLARALKMEPDSPDIYWMRANRLADLNRHAETLNDLYKYLSLEPLDHQNQSVHEQTLAYCERLREQQIEEVSLLNLVRALVALKLRKWKEAAESADLANDPSHRPMGRAVHGFVEFQKKNWTLAEQYFREALELDAGCFLAAYGQARVHEQRERFDQALADFQTSVKVARPPWEKYEAHSGRARVLDKLGRKREASEARFDANQFSREAIIAE